MEITNFSLLYILHDQIKITSGDRSSNILDRKFFIGPNSICCCCVSIGTYWVDEIQFLIIVLSNIF